MAYATTADVAKVITTTEDVSFFLDLAAMVVSEQLEDKELSTLRKKMIEVYLAAHFIAVTDPDTDISKEKMGEAETTYKTHTGRPHAGLGTASHRGCPHRNRAAKARVPT